MLTVTNVTERRALNIHRGNNDINFLYLPAEDVLIEPSDIEASPRIKDSVQVHMIKRFFD